MHLETSQREIPWMTKQIDVKTFLDPSIKADTILYIFISIPPISSHNQYSPSNVQTYN